MDGLEANPVPIQPPPLEEKNMVVAMQVENLDARVEAQPEDSLQGPSTDADKEDTRANTDGCARSGEPSTEARHASSPRGDPEAAQPQEPVPTLIEGRAKRAAAARAGTLWDVDLLGAAEKAEATAYMASIRVKKPKKKQEVEGKKPAKASQKTPPPALAQHRESNRKRQPSRALKEEMVDTEEAYMDAIASEDVEAALAEAQAAQATAKIGSKRPANRPPSAGAKRQRAGPEQLLCGGKRGKRDVLYGCGKCRYLKGGCGTCRDRGPSFTREHARWKPQQGHRQIDIPAAPAFRPTAEEFKDPIAYISKIMPEAMKYGLAHIIPPEGWDPPFALEKGTNGASMESFRFAIRKQLTSHLCYRSAPSKAAADAAGTGARYGKKMTQAAAEATETAAANLAAMEEEKVTVAGGDNVTTATENNELTPDDILAALAAANGGASAAPTTAPGSGEGTDAEGDDTAEDAAAPPTAFGFETLDKKHTLRSFAAYADWVKAVHFSDPPASGAGTSSAPKRRPSKKLPIYHSPPVEPSVEEIEAEFWRIVETPDSYLESLYGQDLDSGHHGSGFPLPEWRRRLLEAHLASVKKSHGNGSADVKLPPPSTDAEKIYAEHAWNINNMPRCKTSMLRYLLGDGLITGVMVPWLYVGSCMSAFCWHVEDHALYSVNYLHMGSPKVWYGVPATATLALEEAMRDALPHLFDASPHLLHQLVTTLSPMELKKRGVPVYRVVHEAGSFIVTMPDAYHAGFNSGFNCAEAVNFAAPGWIPFGTDVAQKYRDANKPVTMSHDSLLVALATAAQHVPRTKKETESAEGGAGAEGQVKDEEAAPGLNKQATGFGPLGDIPWADAPLEGIILGTGELALRAKEESERWATGLKALGVESLPKRAMEPCTTNPGAKDEHGVHVDTAECDCAECNGDLWLAAVVSGDAPGVAVCPEHAAVLVEKHGCPLDSLYMLCRYSPEDMQGLVDMAAERIEGIGEAVAAAHARRARYEAKRVHATPVGALYPTNEFGECITEAQLRAAAAAAAAAEEAAAAAATAEGAMGVAPLDPIDEALINWDPSEQETKKKKKKKKKKPKSESSKKKSLCPPPLPGEYNKRGRPSKAEIARRLAGWHAINNGLPPPPPLEEGADVEEGEEEGEDYAQGEFDDDEDEGEEIDIGDVPPIAVRGTEAMDGGVAAAAKAEEEVENAKEEDGVMLPGAAEAMDAAVPAVAASGEALVQQPEEEQGGVDMVAADQQLEESQHHQHSMFFGASQQVLEQQVADLAAAQQPDDNAGNDAGKSSAEAMDLAPAGSIDPDVGLMPESEEPVELTEARQIYNNAAKELEPQPADGGAALNAGGSGSGDQMVIDGAGQQPQQPVSNDGPQEGGTQPLFDVASLLA